jgi:hypothetical protein
MPIQDFDTNTNDLAGSREANIANLLLELRSDYPAVVSELLLADPHTAAATLYDHLPAALGDLPIDDAPWAVVSRQYVESIATVVSVSEDEWSDGVELTPEESDLWDDICIAVLRRSIENNGTK